MANDPKERLKEWLASGQARLQPLTHTQRELWETSPVPPEDPANHICSYFEIRGPFTFELCGEAIRKVVERQEVMRTSFLPGKERPVQMIRSKPELALRYRALRPDETTPEGLAEAMAEGFGEPFDFLRGPLYRMDLLRKAPEHHVLAFTIHHAVADGWTLGAFVEDLCTAYVMSVRDAGKALGQIRGIRDGLPPLEMSYSDWGAAERARWHPAELARHADYWRSRLRGSRLLFEPGGWADGGSPPPLRKQVTAIPAALTDAARGLARRSGVTLFSALLAAFRVALHRWKGERAEDVVVGTPVANRNRAALRETMGYFAGVVPLRNRLDPGRPFVETLRAGHDQVVEDFAHAMPFAELAASLGSGTAATARHGVFDVRFALQNHPIPDIELPGISTRLRTCSTGTSRFDIGCELTEDGGELELVWLYRPPVVEPSELGELDRLFRAVLGEVCRQPEAPPAHLNL